jgi:hypothetical protein
MDVIGFSATICYMNRDIFVEMTRKHRIKPVTMICCIDFIFAASGGSHCRSFLRSESTCSTKQDVRTKLNRKLPKTTCRWGSCQRLRGRNFSLKNNEQPEKLKNIYQAFDATQVESPALICDKVLQQL